MTTVYQFYTYKAMNIKIPKWKYIYTIIGMDGYLSTYHIETFYRVGEWFVGFILLYYLIFPFLRFCILKRPILLAIVSAVIYIVAVQLSAHGWHINLSTGVIGRLPEFLFGMYFIRYFKNIRLWGLLPLPGILTLYFIHPSVISSFYYGTAWGLCSFLILSAIGQWIKFISVQSPFNFLSKYSFAGIIENQAVLTEVVGKFGGLKLVRSEAYMLLILIFTALLIVSVILYKMGKILSTYFGSLLSTVKFPIS